MMSVVPGINLFRESVEKVLRNQNARFRHYLHDSFLVLDPSDVKQHTHFFWMKEKLTRILARVDNADRTVLVYRREDLDFAKRLAENISSAAGVQVSYDLYVPSEGIVAYDGCLNYNLFVPAKGLK